MRPETSSDHTSFTLRALSVAPQGSTIYFRVKLLEGQSLPEDWQNANFGHLGVDPNADPDGDGRSNFEEYLHNTNPNEYFEGTCPSLGS